MIKVLLTERVSPELPAFAEFLRRELPCDLTAVDSAERAVERIEAGRGAIDIVIVTVDENPQIGFSWLETIRDFAENCGIRSPRLLLLSRIPLSDRHFARLKRYKASGIRYLLRRYARQIVEELKLIVKESTNRRWPDIHVQSVQGHRLFHLIGSAQTVLWELGPKLTILLSYFSDHSRMTVHTTAMISEATGIPKAWVKIYMDRLRKAFDKTRRRAGIAANGKTVFQTTLGAGGFLHRVHGNFVW